MISLFDQDFIYIDNLWYLYDMGTGLIISDYGYKLADLTTLH